MKKKKEYPPAEEQPSIMNEPVASYPVTEKSGIKDKELKPPCQYTVEELREDAARFIERLERGEVEFISNEDMKKRFTRCN